MAAVFTTKICKECGVIMENVGSSRKRCDACNKRMPKRYYPRKYTKPPKRIQGTPPKLTIDDILREAKKEGLQYGHYCVKHGLY